jgi:beta-lactamase superfamily II metal-dependent hydrolase
MNNPIHSAQVADHIRIKMFDLNSPETCHYGKPERQPADSLLIHIREQMKDCYLLLDAGKKGQAEKVIIPYLFEQGITHLDYMILSHQHLDHFGGMIDILQRHEFTIGRFIYAPLSDELLLRSKDEYNSVLWQEFEQVFIEAQARIHEIDNMSSYAAGDRITLTPSTVVDIVALPDPSLVKDGETVNLNNMSIVLRLQHKGFSALFPGDCGRVQAESILQSEQRELLRNVNLLKASHHGGDDSTTSEFIALCNSQIILIPCNELVVEERPSFIQNWHDFGRQGAKLIRCDWYRDVEITTDGETAIQCRAATDQYREETLFPLSVRENTAL